MFKNLAKKFCSRPKKSNGTFFGFPLAVPSSEKFWLLRVTKLKIELFQVLELARYIFQKTIGKPSGYFSQFFLMRVRLG